MRAMSGNVKVGADVKTKHNTDQHHYARRQTPHT